MSAGKRRVHFQNSSLLQNNPYVDSFPRGSPLSPYASSFSSPAAAAAASVGGSGGGGRHPETGAVHNRASRTTKKAQKLVLFPEAPLDRGMGSDSDLFVEQLQPLLADIRTVAEESSRDHRIDLPRVTAYCCGESYDLEEISKYLKDMHGVNAKTYDECLYASYEPATKCAVLGSSVDDLAKLVKITATSSSKDSSVRSPPINSNSFAAVNQEDLINLGRENIQMPESVIPVVPLDHSVLRSEVFIFDYGVIVFWNFFDSEEINYTNILRQFASSPITTDNYEIEELHFQYDLQNPYQPRIYNDMITLKSSNPLIKLTISHGLAQSVKLSLFENIMEEKIENTIELPEQLAVYGEVKMDRTSVMKIVGDLFDFRMNVNLISNVLDIPELFWVEPELQGLYNAIRGYFEISQRASLLNKRVEVVSDLLRMLSDHKASDDNTQITWIVIILVAGCVVVAFFEVWMKMVRLNNE